MRKIIRSEGKRTNTSITLAGRETDPLWPHPCDDDRRLAVAVAKSSRKAASWYYTAK